LIFDPGSKLVAGRLRLGACGPEHRPVKSADNGGLWFLGAFAGGRKKKGRRGAASSFRARSIIGVGLDEWSVREVRSLHPAEDGLNVSSSRVEIRRSLVLVVPRSREADHNLFDLETDDGASFVELPKGCWVRVRGVFGDQFVLSSSDMLRPNTTADNERRYAHSGRLTSNAVIHSLTVD